MTVPAGTRFGPYEVVAALGAGGMGEVYKARDTRLERTVAIKILPEMLACDPHYRERFEREALAISHLDHPHICPLYDVGNEGGTAFLVMQYLEGETLAIAGREAPSRWTWRSGMRFRSQTPSTKRIAPEPSIVT
jgi:eukaryotic-like serine/threonine-protein kinase